MATQPLNKTLPTVGGLTYGADGTRDDIGYLVNERKLDYHWALKCCKSVDDSEAGVILGYPARSGGILFVSAQYGQWQLRPYDPWPSKNAKEGDEPPKYRTPHGDYDIYLPQHPKNETYWNDLEALKKQCIWINGKPYLVATEGVIKAITGCQNNIPTIAGLGVTLFLTSKKKGEPDLVPGLKRLAEAGFNFIIAFDADEKEKTVKNVKAAEKRLTEHLRAYGCDVLSVTGKWKPQEGKGMDDYINKNRIEAFRAILMKAEPIETEPRDTADSKPKGKSKNKQLLDLVETHWGERLRLNEMTQQIELNGKAGDLDIERVYLRLADELGIDVPKTIASDVVTVIAKKYAYSPVRDYLNSLTGIEPINLDNLAERYLGTNDPLHAILLKRTLIAAVARVFDPGCKVDTLLILQGDQGFLKSTFLETLAGKTWFTDNLSEGNEKDEKLKLRRYWLLEYSEFETAFKRKEVSELKSFLSSRVDSLRVPYGKSIEDFPRTSILAGSTNSQQFLHDPTGERRYWVIKVNQRIPIETVKVERDGIWAAAVEAYRNGQQWWLTPKEDELLAEANQGWQSTDTWDVEILKYLENRFSCTVGELLNSAIGLDVGQHGRGEQMRVSDILKRNGWVSVSKRIDGKVKRCWEKVVTEVVTGVVTEVVTGSNLNPVMLSNTPLQPITTFSSNNPQNTDRVTGDDKNGNSQSEKSLEDRGCNTPPNNAQNVSGQEFEPVTTSKSQGCNTPSNPPQCVETIANKHFADMLADRMREAIASCNRAEASEVMKDVAAYPRQVQGFFARSFSKEENISIRLLEHCGLVRGSRVKYVGKDAEQHEGEVLTVDNIDAHNRLTCLRPDGKGYTTWLKSEDLRKL